MIHPFWSHRRWFDGSISTHLGRLCTSLCAHRSGGARETQLGPLSNLKLVTGSSVRVIFTRQVACLLTYQNICQHSTNLEHSQKWSPRHVVQSICTLRFDALRCDVFRMLWGRLPLNGQRWTYILSRTPCNFRRPHGPQHSVIVFFQSHRNGWFLPNSFRPFYRWNEWFTKIRQFPISKWCSKILTFFQNQVHLTKLLQRRAKGISTWWPSLMVNANWIDGQYSIRYAVGGKNKTTVMWPVDATRSLLLWFSQRARANLSFGRD